MVLQNTVALHEAFLDYAVWLNIS